MYEWLCNLLTLTIVTLVGSEPQIVELLPRQELQGELGGDILLGDVLAGSTVTTRFRIKNSYNRLVEFSSVSPTCKCTDIVLPSAKLSPGELLEQEGELSVRIPEVRGNNVTIAALRVKSSDGSQVALMRVIADIRRSIFFPNQESVFTLDAKEDFLTTLSLDLDPSLDPSEVRISSNSEATTIAIKRLVSGEWPCVLEMQGKRSGLLEAKSLILNITVPVTKTQDVLRFHFYDGLAVRAFPANPNILDGKVTFTLFRKEGINSEKLELEDANGNRVEASVRQRTKSVIEVTASVPPELDSCRLIVSDGVINFSLIALRKK